MICSRSCVRMRVVCLTSRGLQPRVVQAVHHTTPGVAVHSAVHGAKPMPLSSQWVPENIVVRSFYPFRACIAVVMHPCKRLDSALEPYTTFLELLSTVNSLMIEPDMEMY